jgi:hypothetical protein
VHKENEDPDRAFTTTSLEVATLLELSAPRRSQNPTQSDDSIITALQYVLASYHVHKDIDLSVHQISEQGSLESKIWAVFASIQYHLIQSSYLRRSGSELIVSGDLKSWKRWFSGYPYGTMSIFAGYHAILFQYMVSNRISFLDS